MSDLELESTVDLINELKRRSDTMFIGFLINKTTDASRRDSLLIDMCGSRIETLGLMDLMREQVIRETLECAK